MKIARLALMTLLLTTPALAQLGFTALTFYAMAASPYRRATKIMGPALGLVVGLLGLTLSGAPTLAHVLRLSRYAREG